MNDTLRVSILLNAAGIPYKIFEKLYSEKKLNQIYEGESFWNDVGISFPKQKILSNLLYRKNFIDEEIKKLDSNNVKFINAFDKDYPSRLKDLKNPPIGLYIKGNADLNLFSVSIVGTRKCSLYGENVAQSIAKSLSESGITVISGGAKGIDTAAHRGSLSSDGVTIAVFGNGLDVTYPSENRDLFNRISEKGALISEYPFGTHGSVWTYPERNRIVSGMSEITIVVESPIDGGAMITANEAKNLKRKISVVPGRINDEVCAGTNKLLKTAEPLVNIEEFINEICSSFGQLDFGIENSENESSNQISTPKIKKQKINIKKFPELSDNEQKIYELLKNHDNQIIDTIISKSGLDLFSVQDALMILESLGLITTKAGRYSISK